ncbi:MAG: hypothetical protein HY236_09160 [Acidobacteria bacterium]|nr:hypothetical protein [Acidobacteriota bacterium]
MGSITKTLLAGMLFTGLAPAAIEPANDILLRWIPGSGDQSLDAKNVGLLREGGVTVVLLPWPSDQATEGFTRACRSAGLRTIAELKPATSLSVARRAAVSAREAGFKGLALEADGIFNDEKALQAFFAEQAGLDLVVYLQPAQIRWQVAAAQAVLRAGQWPGVRSGPERSGEEDIEVSSASREPWVDANSYLVAYLRGMFPRRPAWLGYRPDPEAGVTRGRAVPYETLELGLAEAFAAGGNFVLSIEEDYRKALLGGDPKALAAWRSLGETVGFLRQHAGLFRRPNRARLAVIAGTLEQSGELLNLLYRRNLCPLGISSDAVPTLHPARFRAVVAANIDPPKGADLGRILDYARGGGLLITAPAAGAKRAWWLLPEAANSRTYTDRDIYTFGKGRIIAYHEPIVDPSEFALDVIDAVGVRTRDLRLWNAGAVVGVATEDRATGRVYVTLLNYAEPRDDDFPLRVDEVFQKATLLEPRAARPRELKAVKRGSGTEITVNRLGRFGLIVLEKSVK